MVILCFSNLMYRIGYAEDIHRLIAGRRLMIGGIHIEAPFGEEAHSDGDILLHAISEALLGSLALGDLGRHFPDNSKDTKGMDSKIILKETIKMVRNLGYDVVNIDTSIVLERPKIASYIEDIRQSVANVLEIDVNQVSVKANTNEKIGAIGSGEACKAIAIVLVKKK